MGRLRDDYEAPLIKGMTEEIGELFGASAFLFKWETADNLSNVDPLYSEPMVTPAFKKYPIIVQFIEPDQDQRGDAAGEDIEHTDTIFVAVNCLTKAGVPADDQGDYISAGDTVGVHTKVGDVYIEYDVIKSVRSGWVNNSDSFAGHTLSCVRRQKYTPERKHP